MDFEPLSYEHRERYNHCYAQASQSSSDQCFSVVWGWQPTFGYEVAFEGDFAWVRDGQGAIYAPLGPWESADWAFELAKIGRHGVMALVPENLALEMSEQLGHRVAIEEDRASHEYLYDRDELLNLAGNRNARRRHKINQFLKHHTSLFVPLSDELVPHLQAFQNQWMEHQRSKGADMELLEGENIFIARQFEKWRDFGLIGGALYSGDEMVGYTLAEGCPDGSLQVHVEKANDDILGAYQTVCHAFLERVTDYQVINREEDMGNPGLRQAKLGYGPCRFLRHYRVKWDLDSTEDAPVTFGARPQKPLALEPQEQSAQEEEQVALPPLSQQEVFEKLSCNLVDKSFKAKQRCVEFKTIVADIEAFIDDTKTESWRLSDTICDAPEIGGEEHKTAALHRGLLADNGFAIEAPFCGMDTAYIARSTIGHGGPVIAFLAEYDALPGIGHGCGHNLSGVISLYAAMALRHSLERNYKEATIWVVGTPAEENLGGKIPIAESGVMDEVTLALMLHCCTGPSRIKARFLATDSYEFRFSGTPAHASCNPYDGRSAQSGARLFLDAIDLARQTLPPTNRVSALLSTEGAVLNVIPESATVKLGLRDLSRKGLETLNQRILRMAKGCAMATDTTVSWQKLKQGYDEMKPNVAAEELAHQVMMTMNIPHELNCDAVASSDVGNLSKVCPTLHPYISLSEEDVPIHSPAFAALTKSESAHQALLLGAKAAARIAANVALDPDMARLIRQDFEHPGMSQDLDKSRNI